MPKPTDREITESYDRVFGLPDEEDEALLRHVLLEDEPPQGLHRGGWQEDPEEWEDLAVQDYNCPGWDDWGE